MFFVFTPTWGNDPIWLMNCWAGARPATGSSAKPLDWKVKAWAERLGVASLVARGLASGGHFTIRQAFAASLLYGGRTELVSHNPEASKVTRDGLIRALRENGDIALQLGTLLADMALIEPALLLRFLRQFKCRMCEHPIALVLQGRQYGTFQCSSCHPCQLQTLWGLQRTWQPTWNFIVMMNWILFKSHAPVLQTPHLRRHRLGSWLKA